MTQQHPVRSIKLRKIAIRRIARRTLSIERGSVNDRWRTVSAQPQEGEDSDDHDDHTDDNKDIGHHSFRKQDMIDTKHQNEAMFRIFITGIKSSVRVFVVKGQQHTDRLMAFKRILATALLAATLSLPLPLVIFQPLQPHLPTQSPAERRISGRSGPHHGMAPDSMAGRPPAASASIKTSLPPPTARSRSTPWSR